jgi:hypothetical protein
MGHLLEIKCADSRVNVHILASTSVPFKLTTVQVPNLALTHKKRITVYQRVLLHNGGFCNGCITKGCLPILTNVSYNDSVSQLIYDKRLK